MASEENQKTMGSSGGGNSPQGVEALCYELNSPHELKMNIFRQESLTSVIWLYQKWIRGKKWNCVAMGRMCIRPIVMIGRNNKNIIVPVQNQMMLLLKSFERYRLFSNDWWWGRWPSSTRSIPFSPPHHGQPAPFLAGGEICPSQSICYGRVTSQTYCSHVHQRSCDDRLAVYK